MKSLSLFVYAAPATVGLVPAAWSVAPPRRAGQRRPALFDIDAALGTVVLQNPPNNGTLTTVGSRGQDGLESVGFDIFSKTVEGKATTNTAYAALGKGGTEKLYTVDTATGAATLVGPFGAQGISDLAVPLG